MIIPNDWQQYFHVTPEIQLVTKVNTAIAYQLPQA